jgi:hypothetical protein
MPKARAAKAGWPAATVAFGLAALTIAVLVKVWWPLAILVPATILGVDRLLSRRDRRIAQEREGESVCQFARAFDRRHIDTWIVRAVYEEFSGSFPLRPSDRLKEDLRICDDDLDFGAIHISQRTGRTLDGYERNPMYGNVKTLRDVVMFFQHQPLLGAAQVRQQH